jgi:hypothetical protein
LGDLHMLTGQGVPLSAMVSQAGEVLAVPRDRLKKVVTEEADLSNVILDPLPMMLRDSVAGLISISPDRFLARFLGVSDSGALPG